MNFSKPINFIAIGSLLLGLLVLLILLALGFITGAEIGILTYLIVPVVTAAGAYFIFWYIVERFLNRKIKVIHRIISDKKIADDNLHEYKITEDVLGQLTQESTEYAALRAKQIKDLEEQATFRKEFLGNLAHELKTPVFSIQGYILTLLEGGLEDEKVNREFLQRALSGVDRISNLLEDLDEISRYEFDRKKMRIKKMDVVSLVAGTFRELEQKANEKKITLRFHKNYDEINVLADHGKIHQVLTNLINNSIFYGTEGGQTVVRFHELEMDSALGKKGKILVEVADNGPGIAESHLPRLFERFYRVDKSRSRNVGGSGLGLAIVKHIIEAHGETIKVRSTEGVGSTFSFTLEKA